MTPIEQQQKGDFVGLESMLSVDDRQSSTWQTLKKEFEARIHILDVKNRDKKLNLEDTNFIRGQIAILEQIIENVEPTQIRVKHPTQTKDRPMDQRSES